MKNKKDRDERNVQRCKKCGRVVGCDAKGRKLKCDCKDGHEHNEDCKYLGFGLWDCGVTDQH